MTLGVFDPATATGARPRRRISLGLWLSSSVIAATVAAAILAPVIAPFDPLAVNLGLINAPPGTDGHLLGTDASGRDILSRLLFGARTSLLGPLIVVIVATVLGVAIGALAAWRGGWLDAALSRVTDFLLAFPGLLAAVFAVALFGPGLVAPAIGIAIAYTPVIARLTRTVVLQERSKLYVRADLALGFSSTRTLAFGVAPNALPVVASQSILSFGYALVDLAALSFLGLGVQPPTPDWGVMLNESRSSILQGAWWVLVFPAAAIVLVVVAFNVAGENLVRRRGGGS
ncbi:ABC transporter permease [Microbacterium sp. CCNWLW134]|uniref:ABC transporter permease n=1 Tax=Microbacterium sp. CCNWLW134 TaxID=3122064 RepID=UPI00301032E3